MKLIIHKEEELINLALAKIMRLQKENRISHNKKDVLIKLLDYCERKDIYEFILDRKNNFLISATK